MNVIGEEDARLPAHDPASGGHGRWVPLLNTPNRYIGRDIIAAVQAGGWAALVSEMRGRRFVEVIEGLQLRPHPADALLWLVTVLPGLLKKAEDAEPMRWLDALVESARRSSSWD